MKHENKKKETYRSPTTIYPWLDAVTGTRSLQKKDKVDKLRLESELGAAFAREKEGFDTYMIKGKFFHFPVEMNERIEGVPKVSTSLDKNIHTLIAMAWLIGKPSIKDIEGNTVIEVDFYFYEYAELRGYPREMVNRGGKFIKNLKNELISAAYLTYTTDIEIDGKKYKAHGMPNFYTLFEPEKPGDKWIVRFSPMYANEIKKVIEGGKGYYLPQFEAIADREADKKPQFYFLYRYIVKQLSGGSSLVNKMQTVLSQISSSEYRLEQSPASLFKMFAESVFHVGSYTKPVIFTSILFSTTHKPEDGRSFEVESKRFGEDGDLKDYKNFKILLESKIGVKDFREVYIAFKRNYVLPERLTNESDLIKEILDKTEAYERRIGRKLEKYPKRKQRLDWLLAVETKIGTEKLRDEFKNELKKPKPDLIHFMAIELPKIVKMC